MKLLPQKHEPQPAVKFTCARGHQIQSKAAADSTSRLHGHVKAAAVLPGWTWSPVTPRPILQPLPRQTTRPGAPSAPLPCQAFYLRGALLLAPRWVRSAGGWPLATPWPSLQPPLRQIRRPGAPSAPPPCQGSARSEGLLLAQRWDRPAVEWPPAAPWPVLRPPLRRTGRPGAPSAPPPWQASPREVLATEQRGRPAGTWPPAAL
mmetsp:Transcript_68717/g.179000  ORF Transcript_68717/g.179000 Transcript_68717/m.179000 type:complete len:205 (+) Transcript_68717:54-668(+)